MSRFDVLKKAGSEPPPKPTQRRGNPDYRQFSAYLPLDLYRRMRHRMVERDLDLSEAVEQAVDLWVKEGTRSD